MIKINQHIEIVSTTITGLSSMSQESRDSIFGVLDANYSQVRITIVNDIDDLRALVERKPDLVFLGMKYIPTKPKLGFLRPGKLWLSQYFDKHNVAYTGSGQLANRLEANKPLAKQRVFDNGGATAAFRVVNPVLNRLLTQPGLKFPMFIKPISGGGGSGIDNLSMVKNMIEANSKIQFISDEFNSDSLVEEYLDGREFSVAILKAEWPDKYMVMPIELLAPADKRGVRVLSCEIKASNSEVVSQVTDQKLKRLVSTLAFKAFEALGGRDYGRIDIRLNGQGVPQFLEANLLPSLIDNYGSFPKACLINKQLEFEPMILHITRLGLARSFADVPVPIAPAVVVKS